MYSASPRLENLPNTDPTISKLLWTKKQSHPLALSTPYLRRNLQLFVSSLMRTLLQGSYVHLNPLVEPQSCSLGKRMAHFGSVSTSEALTKFPKRIAICFHLSRVSSMYQERHESTPKSIFSMRHKYPLVEGRGKYLKWRGRGRPASARRVLEINTNASSKRFHDVAHSELSLHSFPSQTKGIFFAWWARRMRIGPQNWTLAGE